MLPNFKTDAKMLAKTIAQIACILLLFSVMFYGLLAYITAAFRFTIGPQTEPTQYSAAEGI